MTTQEPRGAGKQRTLLGSVLTVLLLSASCASAWAPEVPDPYRWQFSTTPMFLYRDSDGVYREGIVSNVYVFAINSGDQVSPDQEMNLPGGQVNEPSHLSVQCRDHNNNNVGQFGIYLHVSEWIWRHQNPLNWNEATLTFRTDTGAGTPAAAIPLQTGEAPYPWVSGEEHTQAALDEIKKGSKIEGATVRVVAHLSDDSPLATFDIEFPLHDPNGHLKRLYERCGQQW